MRDWIFLVVLLAFSLTFAIASAILAARSMSATYVDVTSSVTPSCFGVDNDTARYWAAYGSMILCAPAHNDIQGAGAHPNYNYRKFQ